MGMAPEGKESDEEMEKFERQKKAVGLSRGNVGADEPIKPNVKDPNGKADKEANTAGGKEPKDDDNIASGKEPKDGDKNEQGPDSESESKHGDPPYIKRPTTSTLPIEIANPSFEGLGLAMFGFTNEGAQFTLNNANSWFDFKKMRSYSHNFPGNQYTGLRRTAIANSSKLNILGKGLGVYNQIGLLGNYKTLGVRNFGIETAVNGYSTFGGIYGAAFGVGWEIGRAITKTSWYQNWKYETWIPYRLKTFGY